MSVEQWFEKAIAYFSDDMTPEEIKLFEVETASSEELSRLMQLWKSTDEEATLYENFKEETAALIATHQRLKQDFVEKQTIRELSTTPHITVKRSRQIKFSIWQWVAVAAVISGITLGIELLIPELQKKPSVAQTNIPQTTPDSVGKNSTDTHANKNTESIVNTQQQNQAATLYAEVFTPDKIPDNPNGPLDDAFFYYASGQYENAVTAIDSALTKTVTRGNDTFTPLTAFYASYYKALSLMSLGNIAEAIPLLQQALQQSPAEMLSIKAQWYLSLAYLKEEKTPDAAKTLQLLINNPAAGAYKSRAQKILSGINN